MIVVLHNIRSMHNVGSIFRTADAAGVEKIYICGITPTPIDEFKKPRPQIAKVSLGAENSVEWEYKGQTHRVIENLKKEDFNVFAVEQDENSVPYNKIKLTNREYNKTVLVLGHEIKGLSRGVIERSDKILEIPMAGAKNSLNVSVAFGIIVFSLKY